MVLRRDVMGSVFLRVSTVFSSHAVWAERDPCHEHNSLIVPRQQQQRRVDPSDRHWAHSAKHFSLWPLAAGLKARLRRAAPPLCPLLPLAFFFFDLDSVCFGDRRNVSGILCTCQLKLLWIHSRQSNKKKQKPRKTNAAVPCLDRLTRLGAAAALLMPVARGQEEPC